MRPLGVIDTPSTVMAHALVDMIMETDTLPDDGEHREARLDEYDAIIERAEQYRRVRGRDGGQVGDVRVRFGYGTNRVVWYRPEGPQADGEAQWGEPVVSGQGTGPLRDGP